MCAGPAGDAPCAAAVHRHACGARGTEGAPCSVLHMRVGGRKPSVGLPITWLEGLMVSGARQKCALIILGNGPLSLKGGSAEVGVLGRRPAGAPRGTKMEPAAGCVGMRRPRASPDPLSLRGRSAPPPAARPQGCCPPRRGALTTQWDSMHSIMMPAATRRAGAAPFRQAEGHTGNEAI